MAVLLQGTCHNSAICWPILSQVTLDQELTVQPSKHYLAQLVKGYRLCTAPAAQGVKALLGSLATAGLRLAYQLLAGAVSMDCPGLAFPCDSQYSAGQTMVGKQRVKNSSPS